MQMLQQKTGQEQQDSDAGVVYRRTDKRRMSSRPPSSVEELLDLSKPKLERRPRVRGVNCALVSSCCLLLPLFVLLLPS